jgi:myo-inositol-1-phosphate synthase
MLKTRLFDVLDQRGQKQRWLLNELARRGYDLSESYLSQIKAGLKSPSQRFMSLASEIVGLPQSQLFYEEGAGSGGRPGGRLALQSQPEEDMTSTRRARSSRQPATSGVHRGDSSMEPINVAIVGVGNCASSLVQGVHYYRDADEEAEIPGLMHVNLGGYHIRDINFVAAFDVDKEKVGKDLGMAIFSGQNNTYKFADVPKETGVVVQRGRTLDGLGLYLSQVIEKADPPSADVVKVLKETNTHVLVNYLPVGSEEATKWYVEQAMQAGCAIINCMPVFIAADKTGYWPQRLEDAGIPIIGDDIKSQVGATIVHRTLAHLFMNRGVRIDHTYQLNFGGNTDFLNMLERSRLMSKKISKTQSVTSQIDYPMNSDDVHIGPSDHVPWLTDRKWAYIRLEGTSFGDVPLNVELKLEVWDSPNSAGVVIDAIRCAKIALDRGLKGPITEPSATFMKSPPKQFTDEQAHENLEAFIRGDR